MLRNTHFLEKILVYKIELDEVKLTKKGVDRVRKTLQAYGRPLSAVGSMSSLAFRSAQVRFPVRYILSLDVSYW